MWTDAFAQAPGGAAQATDPTMSMLLNMFPIVAIFVIMYFLLIRPQRQRQKQLDTMIKALKKGDRVLTSGGIFGTVQNIDDAKAVIKISDEVKVEFAKSAIVQVLTEAK